jgi:hypothetical protein
MDQIDQIKELESLYKEFEDKFAVLEKEQYRIVGDFLESVRLKKIEDIKSTINSNY